MRDQLSQQCRDLPWERVDKAYVFDGPDGKETLAELFAGKRQLIVYHFMFDPSWDAGCKSCSFWADNFNAIGVHLKHRDTNFLAISRAPYQKRMAWSFKWLSSFGTDFNFDYYVSFTEEQIAKESAYQNYQKSKPWGSETVGINVFFTDAAGQVFHTYSCYSRGVDMLNDAYHYLALTPEGRDEADERANPPAWVRRHDEYGD